MFDEKMVCMLQEAFENTFDSLKNEYNEEFYYLAFIFDAGMHPYISAWSYEAYERSVKDNKVEEKNQKWWKWDYADSPYVVYGYDKFFDKLTSYLDNRVEKLSAVERYNMEWGIRVDSMLEALIRVRANDKDKKVYENIIFNVEVAPPDGKEAERAKMLNVSSGLLDEYLNECDENADSSEDVTSINWQEIWHPKCCQIILVQPIWDKKLATRIRKDFSSSLSIGEFIKSCNTVPYIISNDFVYKTAMQIISDNKEYGDYIKVELL